MNQGDVKVRNETFKKIIVGIAGIGVANVVDDIIGNALPTEVKLPAKIFHKIGSICLSWLVADWATDRIEMKFDKAAEGYYQIAEKIAEAKEAMEEAEKAEGVEEAAET